jgi:polyhydroxyalkanoate synthase
MPPESHAPTESAVDLALAWQTLGHEWVQWWRKAAAAPPAAPSVATERTTGFPAPLVPPDRFASITRDYQAKIAALWQAAASTLPGQPFPEVVPLPAHDRRFRAAAWRTSPFHSWVLQAYLLHAAYLSELADHAALPDAQRKRLQFMTKQYVDALAPTNFAATNPEVLERAIATEGANFVAGAANLVADIRRGRISMSDSSAFEVGRNLATTPGSVVFRNELIELIQYAPSTSTVHARPFVVVPPCINKYYILDLTPSNSFVRYAVSRGHTTFIVSWRNIPPELGHLTWDDYLERGVLQAIRVAQAIGRSRSVNALGFCVGGTLLASALAVLAARRDATVASATFLATMLDFEDPGDIAVYVTREFLAAREPGLLAGQRLRGTELATAFATLRANDLVWNYVVNNYLKGETPPAFDLLHWNGDSANLPGPMYAYYLRELYLNNRLREPDALTMLGERIDLSRIDMPTYVVATRDDHIVPWRSAYRTTGLVSGDTTFMLGASGHIAGVVNPVEPGKRNHWVNALVTDDPDDWLARAQIVPGSWWTSWSEWLARHAGKRRKAPAGHANATGNAQFPPLDAAPGRYVTERVS